MTTMMKKDDANVLQKFKQTERDEERDQISRGLNRLLNKHYSSLLNCSTAE